MKKWFSWIIKRYTQLKLDKKIALLYTALILIVSVTLTISITHTAGDIILRDRKDLVQQNVKCSKGICRNRTKHHIEYGTWYRCQQCCPEFLYIFCNKYLRYGKYKNVDPDGNGWKFQN